jgi:hydrogenase maturation protease
VVSEPQNPTLVLGLGNDILTDDAIGLRVVRQLRERVGDQAAVDVRETMEMGLALLDFMVGYREVLLVDSIQTGRAPPGFLHEVDGQEMMKLSGRTPHFLGVGDTLALGRQLGLPMPERVRVYAVEVDDPFTLATEMTPALREALPKVVERILSVLGTAAPGPQ